MRRRRPRPRRPGRARRRLGLRRRRRPDARGAARVAEQAVALAKVVAAAVDRERVELAAEPVHADVTWVSSYEIDPFDVPTREKIGAARRLERPAAAPTAASTTSTPSLLPVKEKQVLRRPRRHHDHPAAGARRTRSCTAVAVDAERRVRDDAHARAAGRPRLGVPAPAPAGTGTPSSAALPELLAEKLAAPSVEAGPLRPGRSTRPTSG